MKFSQFFLPGLATLGLTFHASAGGLPGNLGSGLDVLLRERAETRAARGLQLERSAASTALAQQAAALREASSTDASGRVRVYIHLRAGHAAKSVERGFPASVEIVARDASYRAGVLEAWVALDDVPALARQAAVSSVILAVQPFTNVGSVESQGVALHKVNAISSQFDGAGVTIGIISDSFGATTDPADTTHTRRALTTVAQDVASGDLPGPGNPLGNTLPVVVLSDPLAAPAQGANRGSDEGRGMAQIVHDLAPKARLGFATGFGGQVNMANNIRNLAALPGAPAPVAGFKADIIVDDVFYSDAPMFSDGLIANAVDQVAAAGVGYFSSAGNRASLNGYFSDFRLVPAGAGATNGTNLNLTGVDPALYAGGFHNFRNDGGQDIAQTLIGVGASSFISLQWDDPFDVTEPTLIQPALLTTSGNIPAPGTAAVDFPVALTAGSQYRIVVARQAGSPAFDAIVTLLSPSGATLLVQDTDLDETVTTFAFESGNYTIRVTSFQGTTGSFDLTVNRTTGQQRVTVDYNALFFAPDGSFLGSVAASNLVNNQPVEFGTIPSSAGTTVQLVIARANVPQAPVSSRRLRYVLISSASNPQVGEYADYQAPTIFGHNSARGAISVAAYSPFRPFIPENFTAQGPVFIAFDAANNRLPALEVRAKPEVAAADGVNTSAFPGPNVGGDASQDLDSFTNFFGTSAAAPHAAAIGALVLQARGGPGAVTPTQLRTVLQRAGLPHDLDPYFSRGVARASNGGRVTITAQADATGTFSTYDTNVWTVNYVGPGSVTSLSINLERANTTGGTVSASIPGLVFDNRPFSSGGTPFTFGRGSGLTAADVTGTYSRQAPPPAIVGAHFFQLDLTFASGAFTGGKFFTFAADRDELRTSANPTAAGASAGGNNADLLGATISLPDGNVVPGGATFTGTLSDGSTFTGTFVNRLGKGYSPLDGYGLIDAQNAVSQPLP
ncbi:MAG: S8 family serine peptidase [Verrucomicrobia bacterium]|nr:S8 family serine peptidase [Verrucomicrobiota bacterium]